ncbi:putative ABC transporter permease [Lachnospiraceae bacterium MD308]|jgi:uncharacterized membrane protein|nr:putative ABC transporter permease [Lachnospiraceae bacterium MD308]
MTERNKWKSMIEKIGHVCEGKYDSFWPMVMIFFTMSLTGWLWEVCLHLISDGSFVNRGFLHGPWLPIYGSGSILILTLLHKLRKKPLLEFLAIILLCGCIEYYISWFLEQMYDGMRWWDYSDYFLNLNGRVCVEGLLAFGFGRMVIVYFYAPLLDHLFRRIPKKILAPVCLVLILIFCADLIYSGKNPNLGIGIARCR